MTRVIGDMLFSAMTVTLLAFDASLQWGDRFVIPNGEVCPCVRTPEVWALLRLEP